MFLQKIKKFFLGFFCKIFENISGKITIYYF